MHSLAEKLLSAAFVSIVSCFACAAARDAGAMS